MKTINVRGNIIHQGDWIWNKYLKIPKRICHIEPRGNGPCETNWFLWFDAHGYDYMPCSDEWSGWNDEPFIAGKTEEEVAQKIIELKVMEAL